VDCSTKFRRNRLVVCRRRALISDIPGMRKRWLLRFSLRRTSPADNPYQTQLMISTLQPTANLADKPFVIQNLYAHFHGVLAI